MSKFKVGDRVRVNQPGTWSHGTAGVISIVYSTSHYPYHVKFDNAFTLAAYREEELEFETIFKSSLGVAGIGLPPSQGLQQQSSVGQKVFDNSVTVAKVGLEPGAIYYGDKKIGAYEQPDYSKEMRKKRKDEGRCEDCGELLAMTAFGLSDCPLCPKPQVKQ